MHRALLVLALLANTASAEIYKWVDENGVTHFGSQRPMGTESKKVEMKENLGKDGAPVKPIDPDVSSIGKQFIKNMAVDDSRAPLDCAKAVSNGKSGIDTMLETGEQNYRDGYISQADYQRTGALLRKLQDRISPAECSSASGSVRNFYQCMSNNHNHVASCADKHKFGV